MTYNKIWNEKEKDIIIHKDKMNIIESCIDRHALATPDKIAFSFENESGKIKNYSYKQLQEETNKFANLLNSLGILPSSRIFLFLPKIPEMYIATLGTIKQGSVALPYLRQFKNKVLN